MSYRESDIYEMLEDANVDTELLTSVNPMGGDQYELAFETLEVSFNEDEVIQNLESAGFVIDDCDYEAPADRGYTDNPTDVIPFFYVIVTID